MQSLEQGKEEVAHRADVPHHNAPTQSIGEAEAADIVFQAERNGTRSSSIQRSSSTHVIDSSHFKGIPTPKLFHVKHRHRQSRRRITQKAHVYEREVIHKKEKIHILHLRVPIIVYPYIFYMASRGLKPVLRARTPNPDNRTTFSLAQSSSSAVPLCVL